MKRFCFLKGWENENESKVCSNKDSTIPSSHLMRIFMDNFLVCKLVFSRKRFLRMEGCVFFNCCSVAGSPLMGGSYDSGSRKKSSGGGIRFSY